MNNRSAGNAIGRGHRGALLGEAQAEQGLCHTAPEEYFGAESDSLPELDRHIARLDSIYEHLSHLERMAYDIHSRHFGPYPSEGSNIAKEPNEPPFTMGRLYNIIEKIERKTGELNEVLSKLTRL